MNKFTRLEKRECGQSMVEFALVLPVVLLLIFGLLEFGRVINAEITAGHCANELARYGIIKGRTVTDIRNYAVSDDNPVCPTFELSDETILKVTVDYHYPTGTLDGGTAVVVMITYPIEIVVPLMDTFFQGSTDCVEGTYCCPAGTYCAHGRATLQRE
ncbi:MAG: TadE family protein [Anaerolineae bacterium]